MHLDWGEPPNGLLQGGTQMHPDRVRDPIAHEPTTETGLSHTDGALSMARYGPGTATGDFSIMIKDQTGLDAAPSSSDPSLQAGFAVFGHVVAVMALVALATLVAGTESRILVWPAVAVFGTGLMLAAVAAAFYYHFGAWGSVDMDGQSAEAVERFITSLRATTEYVTCLVRFSRVFIGVG